MSKSTSMLPTLAGGSGVAAHTLVDADLMKVVDAVTLNADRDRKVTLVELKSFFNGTLYSSLGSVVVCEMVAWNSNSTSVVAPASVFVGDLTRGPDEIYRFRAKVVTPTAPSWGVVLGLATIRFKALIGADGLWDRFWAAQADDDFPRPVGFRPSSPTCFTDDNVVPYGMPKLRRTNPSGYNALELDLYNKNGQQLMWSAMIANGTLSLSIDIETRAPAA